MANRENQPQPEPRGSSKDLLTAETAKSFKGALYIGEDEMLQFTGRGVKVFRSIATGETVMRQIRTDETEYIINVPVHEQIIDREFTSLNDYIAKNGRQERSNFLDDWYSPMTNPEYFNWKNTLLKNEDFVSAADEILGNQAEEEKDSETVPCSNCKGKKSFKLSCGCKEGGTVFHDMQDGETIYQRKKGEVNPKCSNCGGKGEYMNPCPICEGRDIAKYPKLRLVNEATGQEDELRLDLAKLISAGDVEVDIKGREYIYNPDNSERANLRYSAGLHTFLKKRLEATGVDDFDNVMRAFPQGGLTSELGFHDISFGEARWYKKDGKITRTNKDKEPKKLIEEGQSMLANQYSPETTIRVRPVRPLHDGFNDLLASTTSLGYTLGYNRDFIATGQTGDAFYVLDKSGKAITQLSNDYDLRTSVENAWLRLQDITPQLRNNGQ